MLWGHKAPLCRPSYARYTHWSRPRPLMGQTTGAGAGELSAAGRNPRRRKRLALPQTGAPSLGSGEGDGRRLKEGRTEPDRPSPRLIVVRAAPGPPPLDGGPNHVRRPGDERPRLRE